MRAIGEISLLVAFVSTGYAAFVSLIPIGNSRLQRDPLASTAGLIGISALTLAVATLLLALIRCDFGFQYVTQYASRSLSWHYRLSALWVGQAGSLLLWTWFTGLAAIGLRMSHPERSQMHAKAVGLLMGNVCFLVCVMLFAADPMAASTIIPQEGAGLNPLLQHPTMLIHPPIVFAAYAAWAVPSSLAIAALWSGQLDRSWLRMARPWALAGWTLLGAGLLLGAHWAYQELGWGGYWGWDPVENGSLLPWLTGAAFIHGSLAWRHRQVLKTSVLLLSVLTHALCNFAAFLTRSGIFSSVHAFSESPIGWMFLAHMGGLIAVSLTLVILRRSRLGSARLCASVLARENLVGVSIALLLTLASVILAGTLVAPLSQLLTSRMVEVGPGFYSRAFAPAGILVLAMTAAVPLLRWGEQPTVAQRRLLAASLAASVAAAAFAWASGVREPSFLAVIGCATLTGMAIVAAWWHEGSTRYGGLTPQALMMPWLVRRRQYAAYSVHAGMAILAVGIAGSSTGSQRHDVTVKEGDEIAWAGRHIRYLHLEQSQRPDKMIAGAVLEVRRDGAHPVILRPEKHLHLLQNQWTSEVAIHSTWKGDFYTVLHAGLGDGRVSLTFIDNPMVRWIWMGGIWSGASAVAAAWPQKRTPKRRVKPRPAPSDASIGRTAARAA
jgi:cytochrome c-type biogenesis protein CcmF